jgi:hypothetical protein
MKKTIIYFMAISFSLTTVAFAQEHEGTVKKTGKAIGKGAKKVADKTVEIGAKGVAKVQDRTYDGKVAANGRTVYITEDSRYYYVDKKGRRHFVQENELRDKH